MSVPEQEKIMFTRNLSVMVKSGIPLLQAILTEARQARSRDFQSVLFGIAKNIESGERFSLALARYKNVFGSFYVSVVEAGERSGTLEQNLTYLFEQMTSHQAFKKELTGALVYPAVILGAAVLVGSLMAYFVLPQLTEFLSGFDNAKLPFATRVVIAFSAITQSYGPFIFLAGLVGCFLCYALATGTKSGRDFMGAVMIHLPVLGGIFRRAYLVQFSKMLSTLLKSGLPIHESLTIAGNGLDNVMFRNAVLKLVPTVLQGQPISPFLDRSLFPVLYIQMIEVGEKSAHVEQNLDYLADFYRKEMEYKMKNILTSLEPLLVLFIGAIVLFLALALFMPLYQTIGTL